LNVFLFAFDRPWTASDGVRNWGDSLLQLLGVINQPDLLPPWLYSGSVLNIGVLLGGLAAALFSREFAVRPAPAAELAKGACGGLLMGWGAMLAFGCNIGGFFSALSALSASGVGMMLGLGLGAFLATRYVIWERKRALQKSQALFLSPCDAPPQVKSATSLGLQPVAGGLLLLGLIAAGVLYQRLGHTRLGGFLFFGIAFGFVFQRSRFCLVQAFREPFLTGQSEHTRAAALALILSMIGFSILKGTDFKDTGEWVFPSFWFGSLFGGTLFGAGMVMAGGCGSGAIWRAGEGHVKLWLAVFFFATGASMARLILFTRGWLNKLGAPVFLPDIIGWTGAMWSVGLLMISWYLIAGWNEQNKQGRTLKL
jgi:uncharacterized membrane protein YedE/YeeE